MKNDIPPFTHFDSRNSFHQKNFFAAASCWLLEEKTQRIRVLYILKQISCTCCMSQRLTCTWCSRKTEQTGRRWRWQNELWISKKALGGPQGTSQPSQQDSVWEKSSVSRVVTRFISRSKWGCALWSKPEHYVGPGAPRPFWPCAGAPWCRWSAAWSRTFPCCPCYPGVGLSRSVSGTRRRSSCSAKQNMHITGWRATKGQTNQNKTRQSYHNWLP